MCIIKLNFCQLFTWWFVVCSLLRTSSWCSTRIKLTIWSIRRSLLLWRQQVRHADTERTFILGAFHFLKPLLTLVFAHWLHVCQDTDEPAGGSKTPEMVSFSQRPLIDKGVLLKVWVKTWLWCLSEPFEMIICCLMSRSVSVLLLFKLHAGEVTAFLLTWVSLCAPPLLQASRWMIWWCSWSDWGTRSPTWPSATRASCTWWWSWRAWSVREGDVRGGWFWWFNVAGGKKSFTAFA